MQQQQQTAKEVFAKQLQVEITGCLCNNEWRNWKPGVHNNLVGRAAGFTHDNHLLVSYKPGFMSCETSSWEIQTLAKVEIVNGPNPDRYNYDGPGSKIHS